MKRLLAAVLLLGGCTMASPDAGHEGVVIEKPAIFGHGGVVDTPVKPGLTYLAPTSSVVYVNMQPQMFAIHFEDFMSKDGVPLDFDAGLRLQVTDSVRLVRDYGIDTVSIPFGKTTISAPRWYANNVHKPFESAVRQAVRKHGMNETAIQTTAVEDIDREISDVLTRYFESLKLPVRLVDLNMGRANPPDAIKTQRVHTAEQEQRALTEKQRKLAEDQREAAELSRAKADNAYRQAMQLTPAQFIALENIKMQGKVCAEPNARCVLAPGALPTVDVGR
jgi:regulator of protease activity HflC (stomatin/prohibitin superfamily)